MHSIYTTTSYCNEILHPGIPAVYMITDPENMFPAKLVFLNLMEGPDYTQILYKMCF